jgi:hypothetical protein
MLSLDPKDHHKSTNNVLQLECNVLESDELITIARINKSRYLQCIAMMIILWLACNVRGASVLIGNGVSLAHDRVIC